MTEKMNAARTVERLVEVYDLAVTALRSALQEFLKNGAKPDLMDRANGVFGYPELKLTWLADAPPPRLNRAYARLATPGVYTTTVTRPRMFREYLLEQLTLLEQDYGASFEVNASTQEIPFPYVLDGSEDMALDGPTTTEIARWFPATELAHIGDETADGLWFADDEGNRPLALFDGLRTDYSLARLKHYMGTPSEHVQQYILFTNYHRYVDEFVRWACAELKKPDSPYTALSGAGGVVVTAETADPERMVSEGLWRRHQMPAWHLMAPGNLGVSLVNIGVGPSNAKTATDHLAVLRPQAWLMIGHCGGLRPSQIIGDYVLAHAYLRDDHVMDHILPTEIPIPPIAEVQRALWTAAEKVTGEQPDDLKRRLRTGTVVTTDDRNWELRYSHSAVRFSQSRAVAVDMESATIAAQGYRFRVPYGTLLCVSDKPLHGEIKLPGQANRFYERAIAEHIQIGFETVDQLRGYGSRLHSRKLRAFDEPPFR
ncbi:MAG: AMP nucleosidase [Caulobacteraceae bacterium]|nr:AMP nucleosidase [Caulobacteraceae bacterium]